MKYVHLIKASWSVEKINENDWTIKSPDGMYKDEKGKEYHFKTKEEALEELDYLRAEHKFDKQSSKKVMSKVVQVNVNNIDWYWDDMEDEDLKAVKSLPKTYKKLNVEVEDEFDEDEIYNNIAYELKNVYGYMPKDYDYVVIK